MGSTYILVGKAQPTIRRKRRGIKPAQIKNLFNEKYFSASSNTNSGKYIGAPRSLYLKANYDF
jgi:outer membrane receptor for Fe3+-dicitrate